MISCSEQPTQGYGRREYKGVKSRPGDNRPVLSTYRQLLKSIRRASIWPRLFHLFATKELESADSPFTPYAPSKQHILLPTPCHPTATAADPSLAEWSLAPGLGKGGGCCFAFFFPENLKKR